MILMEFDLSQAEARAVAWYCGDEGLKAGFKQEIDVHSQRAAMIFGYTYEDFHNTYKSDDKHFHDLRFLAKIIVHAVNYDASARTVNSTLKTHGVYKKESEVKVLVAQIHEAFPGIRQYQWAVQNQLKTNRILTTAKGMRRYFYSKLDSNTFRRAYAFLPQCTVAEITNDGIVESRHPIEALGGFILLQVHDSILLEVPREHMTAAYNIITTALTKPLTVYPFFGEPDDLVIPVECKIGSHWGELKEWKPTGS